MNKFVALTIILVLLGTVGAAGCLAKDPTTTATQEHNATLEKYVNVTKQAEYGNKTKEVLAWLVTWNNDSSVSILETVKNRTDNSSVSSNFTLNIFESTQDATNYLKGLDKSDYSLISTSFKKADAQTLNNVTGHVPSVYAEYLKTEGSIFDLTYKATLLMQYDNIIGILSAKWLSFGSGGSSASSNQSIPALISIPSKSVTATPTPTAKATATPTPTPTPAPTTTTKSVTIYAERGCPHCEAAIADYTSQGYVVTVLYEGDPGFVPQASYPGIVVTG